MDIGEEEVCEIVCRVPENTGVDLKGIDCGEADAC